MVLTAQGNNDMARIVLFPTEYSSQQSDPPPGGGGRSLSVSQARVGAQNTPGKQVIYAEENCTQAGGCQVVASTCDAQWCLLTKMMKKRNEYKLIAFEFTLSGAHPCARICI
jgi:hypothetical protein